MFPQDLAHVTTQNARAFFRADFWESAAPRRSRPHQDPMRRWGIDRNDSLLQLITNEINLVTRIYRNRLSNHILCYFSEVFRCFHSWHLFIQSYHNVSCLLLWITFQTLWRAFSIRAVRITSTSVFPFRRNVGSIFFDLFRFLSGPHCGSLLLGLPILLNVPYAYRSREPQ